MAGRLMKEYREQQKEAAANPDADVQLEPIEGDLNKWLAVVTGPEDTPFEGGRFELDVTVPSTYPLSPPNIRFQTKIFHPNVHPKTGEICLDILKNAWSPAWTLQSSCRAIIILLSDPEPDSPLNCDAGNLLRNGDVRGFQSLAKMYTALFASSDKSGSSS
jgi:peroxin-4